MIKIANSNTWKWVIINVTIINNYREYTFY